MALSQLHDLVHQRLVSGGKRQNNDKIVYLCFDLGKLPHFIACKRMTSHEFIACKNAGKRNGLFPKDTHDLFCTIAHPVDKDRTGLRLQFFPRGLLFCDKRKQCVQDLLFSFSHGRQTA